MGDGSAKYGGPLVPILDARLAYDEPYMTDASAQQCGIWLARFSQAAVSEIDANMSQYPATPSNGWCMAHGFP
ncbi:hypothetical protein BU15DRAFT_76839 [Melanogaster broomeanus]|nr:hypothetical protein BU15DRAFT_76839 [Melanogaster broomeanus]